MAFSMNGITITGKVSGGPAAGFTPSTVTYTSNTTITVPSGATSATISAWGAGGGAAKGASRFWSLSGGGGFARGTISVTGGNTFVIHVGGGGTSAIVADTYPAGIAGGTNGGGNGISYTDGSTGGAGGGYSGVFLGTAVQANSLVIAGGGGGGGGRGDSGSISDGPIGTGGWGGGTVGANGSGNRVGLTGTQTEGGLAGSTVSAAVANTAGSALQGGNGYLGSSSAGGGGGGGYYGGGGGGGQPFADSSGGGGGSGFVVGTATSVTNYSGIGSSEPGYVAGVSVQGTPSTPTNGGPGLIMIEWT